jgi:hypothetical protein
VFEKSGEKGTLSDTPLSQEYTIPPVPESVTGLPSQTAVELALYEMKGVILTVTVITALQSSHLHLYL